MIWLTGPVACRSSKRESLEQRPPRHELTLVESLDNIVVKVVNGTTTMSHLRIAAQSDLLAEPSRTASTCDVAFV